PAGRTHFGGLSDSAYRICEGEGMCGIPPAAIWYATGSVAKSAWSSLNLANWQCQWIQHGSGCFGGRIEIGRGSWDLRRAAISHWSGEDSQAVSAGSREFTLVRFPI